jgi:hypothetical protein
MIVWAAEVSVAEEVVRRRDAPTRKREYGPVEHHISKLHSISTSPVIAVSICSIAKSRVTYSKLSP